jgi:voltage-gated potassium channel Kch
MIGLIVEYLIYPETFKLVFKPSVFFISFFVLCILIFIQASTEELFFRGYLLQNFSKKIKNQNLNISIIALIFMSLHMLNPEVIRAFKMGWIDLIMMVSQYFIVGWSFGKITLMSNSLELAIAVHVTNNVFLSTVIGYKGTVLDTDKTIFYSTNFSPKFSFFLVIIINIVLYYILKFIVSRYFSERLMENKDGNELIPGINKDKIELK